MTLPAAARIFGWEFVFRHRWGFAAMGAYILLLAAQHLFAPVDDPDVGRFVGTTSLPLSSFAFYLLAVFSFGFGGDVAARQSMYPARFFVLPLSTLALTLWPMIYGAVGLAMLGLAAQIAPFPTGIDPPLWTILLALVVLAWIQALTWMSYPARGLRIAAAVTVLAIMDVVMVVAIELRIPAEVMVLSLTPLWPVACVAAYAAVRRARRGDVPRWGSPSAVTQLGGRRRVRARTFSSRVDAQAWCEWREYGWSLPLWAAIAVAITCAALFADEGSEPLLWIKLVVAMLTPPLMATFVAATVRKPGAEARDGYGLPPFLATRPLTSAEMIAAKLRAATWSTAIAWLITVSLLAGALALSGTWVFVGERVAAVRDVIGTSRTAIFALLVLALFVSATWKRLVLSLYVGLSGRAWLVRAHVGLALVLLIALLIVIGPLRRSLAGNSAFLTAAWTALPWVLAAMVALKLAIGGWMIALLQRERLLPDRTIVTSAALWTGTVFVLYGVLAWMASTPHMPRYLLMLLAILATPLARLSAAPLALAWNRHR